MTPILPQYIDSTMISCFRSCPQKFYNEFCLGLRPSAISVDLHAGACFALALETVYETMFEEKQPFDKAILRAYSVFMDAWGDFIAAKDTPKTKENTWAAVEEYFKQWPPLTDPVQPFNNNAQEFTFGIPLVPAHTTPVSIQVPDTKLFPLHPSGEPFIYCGKFDLLGLWSNKPVVRDEKTTTSIGQSWAEQWDLRSQFMGYCWACQQSGIPVDTVIVRGVGILKTKISLAEAIKTYSDVMIARWYEQLRRDLWRLRQMWDEDYWDKNYADACSSYGGCVFRDSCASATPEAWFSNFTVRRWNPLLKNPTEEKAA